MLHSSHGGGILFGIPKCKKMVACTGCDFGFRTPLKKKQQNTHMKRLQEPTPFTLTKISVVYQDRRLTKGYKSARMSCVRHELEYVAACTHAHGVGEPNTPKSRLGKTSKTVRNTEPPSDSRNYTNLLLTPRTAPSVSGGGGKPSIYLFQAPFPPLSLFPSGRCSEKQTRGRTHRATGTITSCSLFHIPNQTELSKTWGTTSAHHAKFHGHILEKRQRYCMYPALSPNQKSSKRW